ncbi:Protein sirB2 [Erwinia piriflorinigrans CFBP 5888]|uniref:Protein sirB2 n=1 Tax=Erwinia piriflorinigrans CFBP 5888 TaxID=1161919 RepID=V5Z710_9GAMM|nr:Protein sirB2 [Erwinia piriflorinigrans CFBP 5888]
MVAWYTPLKNLHLPSIAITTLMLRTHSSMLLTSGVVTMTHFYLFSAQGNWLTEKPFGVIICLALSFIALGRRPRTQKSALDGVCCGVDRLADYHQVSHH